MQNLLKGLVIGASTSATTPAMVLSPEVRRNEWFWQILNIGNVFRAAFGFRNSQSF